MEFKKRAYITGATGCVGRNLVDELLNEDWHITVLHRPSSNLAKLKGLNLVFREVDLHSLESVIHALKEPAEAFFHIAANVSDWPRDHEEQYLDNVLGTSNICKSLLITKNVSRLIYCSTGAVKRLSNIPRVALYKCRSGYIRTKALAESEVNYHVNARGLDAVILRPFIVIGKYDYNNYSQIFKMIGSGKCFFSFPGELYFTHAKSVAKAFISAYHFGKQGATYHLPGEKTSWHDVFCRIAKILKKREPLRPFPLSALYFFSHLNLLFHNFINRKPTLTPEFVDLINEKQTFTEHELTKAKEDLRYESLPLDQALEDCHTWLVHPT